MYLHTFYIEHKHILHQMGKCLLKGWNFTRHDVNFITTKSDPEKNGGKKIVSC